MAGEWTRNKQVLEALSYIGYTEAEAVQIEVIDGEQCATCWVNSEGPPFAKGGNIIPPRRLSDFRMRDPIGMIMQLEKELDRWKERCKRAREYIIRRGHISECPKFPPYVGGLCDCGYDAALADEGE